MKLFCGLCSILTKEEPKPGFFSFVLFAPEAAMQAVPGQFAHILCGARTLRRPISICDFDAQKGTLRIVFEVRGEGTKWLSGREAGDSVDILAPAGNGFILPENPGRILLAGGGIGTPPLLALAKRAPCDAVLGFKNAAAAILTEEFGAACGQALTVTDDGSLGETGLVTGPAARLLRENRYGLICACGPTPMLKAISARAEQSGVPCLVSLEERMACGMGACLCCAAKLRVNDKDAYVHVCKAGPVFDSKKVVFE